MRRSLERLAARKQLLLAQSQLLRMQLALHVDDARNALRPAGLIGAAMLRPATLIALLNLSARLLGWRRLARLVPLGAIAFSVFRILRTWRSGSSRPT